MAGLELTYLSGPDVDRLELGADDILEPVERVLAAMGRGETVIEPRVHLFPGGDADGHFNVLRGALPLDGVAGVKVVGDYVGNGERGLPSELALLLLFDATTGAPRAIVDATAITAMRTGAVTAIGARHLARRSSRVLGHIGSRGTAEWNVRLLRRVLPELAEVRIHSRTPASREELAARLDAELDVDVHAVGSWEECVRGADVVVEATRLVTPEPLLRTAWIEPGALVVPYGTVSAVEADLTDVMDKVVVDDWRQARAGPLGALRTHVDSGRLNEQTLHAELGQIVCGDRPGRESDAERILLWHRGLSLTDIALGRAMLARARERGLGTLLPYRDL
jgi:ornithine cyclodeaminase/alanine dehydrogenase-like protein (mu-crystallin family)